MTTTTHTEVTVGLLLETARLINEQDAEARVWTRDGRHGRVTWIREADGEVEFTDPDDRDDITYPSDITELEVTL